MIEAKICAISFSKFIFHCGLSGSLHVFSKYYYYADSFSMSKSANEVSQHFSLWALHRPNAMNPIKDNTVHTNATPKDCLDV